MENLKKDIVNLIKDTGVDERDALLKTNFSRRNMMKRRNFLGLTPSILLLPYTRLSSNETKERILKVGDRVRSKLIQSDVGTITNICDNKIEQSKEHKVWDYYYPNWKNENVYTIEFSKGEPVLTTDLINKFYSYYSTSLTAYLINERHKILKACEKDIIFED